MGWWLGNSTARNIVTRPVSPEWWPDQSRVIIPFESYVTRDTCDTCGRTEGDSDGALCWYYSPDILLQPNWLTGQVDSRLRTARAFLHVMWHLWHHGDIAEDDTGASPPSYSAFDCWIECPMVIKFIAGPFFVFKNNIQHVSWALELIGRLHFRTNAVCATIIFGGSFQWANHMKGFQNSFVHMDIMPLSRVLTQN